VKADQDSRTGASSLEPDVAQQASDTDALIARFAALVENGEVVEPEGAVRVAVDLGTANIVVSAVDSRDEPVAGAWQHSTVVRDGVVVDWLGATTAVRELTEQVADRLDRELTTASVTIPPGISAGTVKVFSNVIEAAGLEVAEVVDEPVAAARALGLRDGCVVDIGHGTTGVSVLADGEVVFSADQATGGHHMTLVLAGHHGLEYEEAEAFKKDLAHLREVQLAIRPTLEKMAHIARDYLQGQTPEVVHLVGGSATFPVAPQIFAEVLGTQISRPAQPLFVTPLGAAMAPRGRAWTP